MRNLSHADRADAAAHTMEDDAGPTSRKRAKVEHLHADADGAAAVDPIAVDAQGKDAERLEHEDLEHRERLERLERLEHEDMQGLLHEHMQALIDRFKEKELRSIDYAFERLVPFERLVVACVHGDLEVLAALLANQEIRSLANQEIECGISPLHLVSFTGHEYRIDCIVKLLEAGADINKACDKGLTAIMWAAWKGDASVVQLLLEARADVDHVNTDGRTALMLASLHGHASVIPLLLGAKAEVNRANANGMTSLMFASKQGHTSVVSLLLAAGAEVNRANAKGMTALMLASHQGHASVVNELLVHLPRPLRRSARKPKPIYEYSQFSASEPPRAERPPFRRSARLEARVHECDSDAAEAGAGVNKADANGETSLMYPSGRGHESVIPLLLDAMADVNHESARGMTSLMYASQNGHHSVVQLLREAGADAEHTNHRGETARNIASNGHVVEVLTRPTIFLD